MWWSFFLSFLEPTKIPITDIVAQVESTVKDIYKNEADTIRPETSLTLELQQSKPPGHNLAKEKLITILPSDEGWPSVVLDKQHYVNKYKEISRKDFTNFRKCETKDIPKIIDILKLKIWVDNTMRLCNYLPGGKQSLKMKISAQHKILRRAIDSYIQD